VKPENVAWPDAGLPVPEKHSIRISGNQPARLAAEVIGVGIPFLWSHALMGSMAQDLDGRVLAWRDLADIARVIRFDARGHGRSDSAGVPEDYAWASQAHSLWQVVDYFSEERVVLGGASMGSAVSLHAASLYPERVKGLVLVIPPRAWEWREGKAGGYRLTARIVKYTRGLPFRLLGRIPFSTGSGFRGNARGLMVRDLAGVDYRGIVGAMRGAALSDFPAREVVSALAIPTLILAWPEDATHPLAVAEELHRVLPDSRMEIAFREEDPYSWPETVRDFIVSLNP
jgi:pimeloyl-ACP methyl ester carboxylesterase